MQNNSLYGSTPSSLGDLPGLTQLVLNWNFLEGNLPVNQLAQMKGLNSVQLGGNQFTGTIPAAFGEQKQLELFVVNNNQLEGTVPEALCDLELLTYMQFRHNKLIGTLPSCIGNLKKLVFLEGSNNRFTGE